MECCVGVSTETDLQVVKFDTVVKKNFKKTYVSDCSPSSEWMNDEGLQSETSVFLL